MTSSRSKLQAPTIGRQLLARLGGELGLAAVLGGVPALILIMSGAAHDGASVLDAAATTKHVLWYYLGFFVLHAVVAVAERCWWFETPEALGRVTRVRRIANEIGASFIATYRVLAGALLVLAGADLIRETPILGLAPWIPFVLAVVLLLGAAIFSEVQARATEGLV